MIFFLHVLSVGPSGLLKRLSRRLLMGFLTVQKSLSLARPFTRVARSLVFQAKVDEWGTSQT